MFNFDEWMKQVMADAEAFYFWSRGVDFKSMSDEQIDISIRYWIDHIRGK